MQDRTYSISVRLRRTRTEVAYVSVPVVGELVRPVEGTSTGKIDADKLWSEAIRIGKLESTAWESEGEPQIEPHPIQCAPPRIQ